LRHVIIKKNIIIKSQLKIGYEKTHDTFFLFLYSYKNKRKADEIKNNVFIIKWDKRQETRKEEHKWEMKEKIMSLCLTFFFLQNKKKTYESERWLQFMKKLKTQ